MKNLNEEYNKNIENDIPDLWSRIDTKLDEIEGANITVKKEKKVRKTFYSPEWIKMALAYAGACAGVIAAVVLLGLLISIMPKVNHKTTVPTPPPQNGSTLPTREPVLTPLATPTAFESPEDNIVIPDSSDAVITFDDGTYLFNKNIYLYRLSFNEQLPEPFEEYYGEIVILSNSAEITFIQAYEASPLVADSKKAFAPEDAVFVSFILHPLN